MMFSQYDLLYQIQIMYHIMIQISLSYFISYQKLEKYISKSFSHSFQMTRGLLYRLLYLDTNTPHVNIHYIHLQLKIDYNCNKYTNMNKGKMNKSTRKKAHFMQRHCVNCLNIFIQLSLLLLLLRCISNANIKIPLKCQVTGFFFLPHSLPPWLTQCRSLSLLLGSFLMVLFL